MIFPVTARNKCVCDLVVCHKQYFPYFLAFSEEFIGLKVGKQCRANSTEVLRKFMPLNYTLGNNSNTMEMCKEFCGMKGNCWGCAYICNQSCQWNAIQDCVLMNRSIKYTEVSIVQKMGKTICEFRSYILLYN